ncbi:MAG: transposase, partial [Acidobacteriota bacterium]|nr:transposase [Acidobacteriota bacterium]
MTNTSQEEKLKLILTQEEAEEVFSQGRELVVFYLLELSKRNDELERRIAELERRSSGRPSSTPSGMIPPYEKAKSRKRGKKPGRKPGHAGSRRARPPKVDRTEEHRLEQCPHCQNPVDAKKPARKRRRIIEDLQESETEAVEHLIHGCWCPVCKKIVEPQIIDALPKSTVGHRAVALTAWLHYGVGITLSQILEVLNHHFHFQVSAGGLVQMWYRIQAIFHAWYEQIEAEAREASYLHADESGWRVNGSTDWLWCFTNEDLTYYMREARRDPLGEGGAELGRIRVRRVLRRGEDLVDEREVGLRAGVDDLDIIEGDLVRETVAQGVTHLVHLAQ